MSKKFKNSQTIVENTDNLLEENELLDYIVKVEDENFRCHRVILAASSHFFRALFRSNMKEEKEGCVTLSGMSAPTFQFILKSLYTGEVDLRSDNFIEVWQAADQLQVDFIVQNCEDFACEVIALENFEVIFKTAKSLNSKKVLDIRKTFLLEKFDEVSGTDVLMDLEFNDFNELIGSHDLKVSSEDIVLSTVMKWVEYFPENCYTEINDEAYSGMNNLQHNSANGIGLDGMHASAGTRVKANENKRIELLTTLLKSVRTCLVTSPLLMHFLKHRLILDNTEAKDILGKAVLHTTTHKQGQWPTAAIHRACSEFEHCGIVCIDNSTIYIVTAASEELYKCASNNIVNAAFVVFDSDLYMVGAEDEFKENSTLFALSDGCWNNITEIEGCQLILIPYEEFIFALNKANNTIYTITRKKFNTEVEDFTELPESLIVKHALIYQRKILIFCSVTVNGEEKTRVHQLDILTEELTELEQLNGPAEQIISFSDDNNTYVLQTNGNLWSICLSGSTVSFKYVIKLWTIHRKLHGALTYRQKLLIFGQNTNTESDEQKLLYQVKGYFNIIRYWGHDSTCSNFVPIILPKSELVPYQKK
ncbi:uncharacterized protein LOC131952738 [Physella acuta]|uniref:uncharacterized protein LOC131952738 n=1 Tax=Physella acuta TaxID=109671 RepID=UPI0027DAE94F|nr:uncharacterized protein LOC131952738 [Physella acuta]